MARKKTPGVKPRTAKKMIDEQWNQIVNESKEVGTDDTAGTPLGRNEKKAIIICGVVLTLIFGVIGFIAYENQPTYTPAEREAQRHIQQLQAELKVLEAQDSIRNQGRANAPASSDVNVKPLYDEVQRRKAEQGISDREAVNQILKESGQ